MNRVSSKVRDGDPPLTKRRDKWYITDHQIFLSYPALDQDPVENFAEQLLQNGIIAWFYPIGKTLSAATWIEMRDTLTKPR